MNRPLIVLEDGVEVLGTTGDLDAFNYGGGVFFRTPNRKELYWQFWGEPEVGKNYRVYTAPIPDDMIDHFEITTQDLCMVSELEISTIRSMLRSKKLKDRFELIQMILELVGPSGMAEGEIVAPWQLVAQWGDVFGIDSGKYPELDFEDYIIRKKDENKYETGTVDGLYLGKFKKKKELLAAIADHIEDQAAYDANVFYERKDGDLELILWEREEFIGKSKENRSKMVSGLWKRSVKKYIHKEMYKRDGARRLKEAKDIMRHRRKVASRHSRKDRLERARAVGKAIEELR